MLLSLAACGGNDEGGRPAPTASTSTVPEAGRGSLVIGPDRLEFEVRTCTDEPAADDRPQAHRVFLMEGEGTVDGAPFAVQAVRFEASGPGVQVFTVTETVQVTTGTPDDLRGIEAERSNVGDDWFDARDPDADGPLIEDRDDLVRAAGTFGPEGSTTGEPDVVEGRLIAHCPG